MFFSVLGLFLTLLWLVISILDMPVHLLIHDLFIVFGLVCLVIGAKQQGQLKMMYFFLVFTGIYGGIYLTLLIVYAA